MLPPDKNYNNKLMVGIVRLELTRISPTASKTVAATNYAISPNYLLCVYCSSLFMTLQPYPSVFLAGLDL